MKSYFIKRIFLIFVTAFVILSLTFILMKLLPDTTPSGFPAQVQAYYIDQVQMGYAKDLTELTPSLGEPLYRYTDTLSVTHYIYKTPVMEQYWRFLVNVFTQWNWGTSTRISVNSSAIAIIAERLPVTMSLNVISIVVAVPLGFLFGIIAALRKNKLSTTCLYSAGSTDPRSLSALFQRASSILISFFGFIDFAILFISISFYESTICHYIKTISKYYILNKPRYFIGNKNIWSQVLQLSL